MGCKLACRSCDVLHQLYSTLTCVWAVCMPPLVSTLDLDACCTCCGAVWGTHRVCRTAPGSCIYFVLISVPHLLQNLFEEYMLWIVTCFANVTPESVVRGAGGTHDRFYQVRLCRCPPCTSPALS